MKGIVYGKGINDAGRPVSRKTYKNGVITSSWVCPKYEMWKGMLRRCLDDKFKIKTPRYLDCTVCDEWLSFKSFESWVGELDVKVLELDKDIKFSGNKHYSPQTCFLVPPRINTLMLSTAASRGEYPIGVYLNGNRFCSQISDQFNNKQRSLGYYDDPHLAHRAWQSAKIDHIRNTVSWWFTCEMKSSYNQDCADCLEQMALSIESDWEHNRETILK